MLVFGWALCGLYLPAANRDWRAGQGLVEYALILGCVAVLVIVALIFMREQIVTLFSRAGNSLGGPSNLGAPSGPSGPFVCPPPSQNPNCTP